MRTLQIDEDADQRRRLLLAVQGQLRRVLSDSPAELAEYVVVLLSHGKSQREVGEALAEFLQDAAPRFAGWLFGHLKRRGLDCCQGKRGIEPEGGLPASLSGRLSRVKRDRRRVQEDGAADLDLGKQAIAQRSGRSGDQGDAVSRRLRTAPGKREDDPVGDECGGRAGEDAPTSKRSRREGSPGRWAGRGTEPPSRIAAVALKSLLGVRGEEKRARRKARAKSNPKGAKERREGCEGALDVFQRLGNGEGGAMPPGNGSGSGRTSVFKRLEGKAAGVNMQVRMDNRTHQGGQSTTFMVTVNNSAQVAAPSGGSFEQKTSESRSRSQSPIAKARRCGKPLESVVEPARRSESPPAEKEEAAEQGEATRMEELARLRLKLGQMEEDIANLRAKGRMLERHEGAGDKGSQPSSTAKQPRSPTSVMADVDRRCVVVQNVHFHAAKEVLAAHFGQCGRVADVTFVLNAFGFSKGYAFVEFQDPGSVEKALALSGSLLMHRVVKVIRKETRLPGSGASKPSEQPAPSPFHPAAVPGQGWKAPFRRASGGHVPARTSFARSQKANFRYVRGGSDPFPATALPGPAAVSVSCTQGGKADGSNPTAAAAESDSGACTPGSLDLEIMCPPERNALGNSTGSVLVEELGRY